MTAGVTTPNLPETALADEILVNRAGNTERQTVAALSAQLVSVGPLAAVLQSFTDGLSAIQLDLGPIYPDVSAGLAATTTGQQFRVASADPDIAYFVFHHDAGPVASLVAEIPAVSALVGKADQEQVDDLAAHVGAGPSALSGYAALIGRDESGRAAIAIRSTGEVEMPATPAMRVPSLRPTALSNYLVEIGRDQAGRVPLGISRSGNPIFKGREIDMAEIGDLVAGLQGALDPTPVIDCWGDSMTHGNTAGVTTPFPAALAALMPGRTVNNLGKSGRTSLQIATAFGAVPSILTVAGNTIPASGGVSVTLTEEGNFSSKANFGTINVLGSLFGIAGTLAVQFNAGNPNLPGTTTFTRGVSGSALVIPNRTPFIPATNGWEGNTVVIWSGRNDIISGFSNDAILSNLEAMVDFQSALRPRFVILTVTDQASEPSGSAGHTQILALNHEIMRRWPRNAVDIRKILVNAYDPGQPADVTAFGQDRVPPSLQSDGLHLNDAGYARVALAVSNFLAAKGW